MHEAGDRRQRGTDGQDMVRAGPPFAPHRVPLWGSAVFFASLLILGGVFVGTASYARQEVLSGALTPTAGVSAIVAVQPGVISAVHVREGQSVAAGAPLVSISVDTELEGGPAAAVRSLQAIEAQELSIGQQRASARMQLAARRADHEARQAALHDRLASLRTAAGLAEERVASSAALIERAEPAFRAGYIAEIRMQQWRNELIQARLAQTAANRDVAEALSSGEQLVAELTRIEAEARAEDARLTAAVAQTEERAAIALASQSIVLRARVAGEVSTLRARPGGAVAAGETLAVLSPPGSSLQAEVWAPSRAVGFLRSGAPVRLMYEAFPYQKFGMARGRVVAVSRAPLPPAATGAEPVYRVIVDLDRQSQQAFGEEWPLAPGMRVSAIVVLERRSALMWLLEPVMALRRRAV